MWMFVNAAKGKIAVFDRETYACWGGEIGGRIWKFFYRKQKLEKEIAGQITSFVKKEFLENFLKNFSIRKMPIKYVIFLKICHFFKPLKKIDPSEELPNNQKKLIKSSDQNLKFDKTRVKFKIKGVRFKGR